MMENTVYITLSIDDSGGPGNHHMFKYSLCHYTDCTIFAPWSMGPKTQCMYLCHLVYVFQHIASHDHVYLPDSIAGLLNLAEYYVFQQQLSRFNYTWPLFGSVKRSGFSRQNLGQICPAIAPSQVHFSEGWSFFSNRLRKCLDIEAFGRSKSLKPLVIQHSYWKMAIEITSFPTKRWWILNHSVISPLKFPLQKGGPWGLYKTHILSFFLTLMLDFTLFVEGKFTGCYDEFEGPPQVEQTLCSRFFCHIFRSCQTKMNHQILDTSCHSKL